MLTTLSSCCDSTGEGGGEKERKERGRTVSDIKTHTYTPTHLFQCLRPSDQQPIIQNQQQIPACKHIKKNSSVNNANVANTG